MGGGASDRPSLPVGSGVWAHHLTFSWDTGSRASRLSRRSNLLGWAVLCKEMASGMPLPLLWEQILCRDPLWGQNFK